MWVIDKGIRNGAFAMQGVLTFCHLDLSVMCFVVLASQIPFQAVAAVAALAPQVATTQHTSAPRMARTLDALATAMAQPRRLWEVAIATARADEQLAAVLVQSAIDIIRGSCRCAPACLNGMGFRTV